MRVKPFCPTYLNCHDPINDPINDQSSNQRARSYLHILIVAAPVNNGNEVMLDSGNDSNIQPFQS